MFSLPNSYYYFFTVVSPLIMIILPIGQKSKKQKSESSDVRDKQSEVVGSKETKVE